MQQADLCCYVDAVKAYFLNLNPIIKIKFCYYEANFYYKLLYIQH